ncbi:MAG TPA: sucrase ferredoxin [Thermomicrobiales bacterium]|nr:sucrase ferredoxin [Thermomicrobiales bacterium]
MATTSTIPAPGRFCSVYTAEIGEDPVGSAWAVDRYLAIEFPLPWPYEVLDARQLPEGLKDVIIDAYRRDLDIGFLGIAPDEGYAVPGRSRVIDCFTGPGHQHRYLRREYLLPTGAIVPLVAALIDDPDASAALPFRLPDSGTRDLLVCTHGSVDICCGTFGYPAYRILRKIVDSTSGQVRAWRCTHFGGHRFAPTALELPDGRSWGLLDMTDLARLVHRDRPVSELAHRYRGSTLLKHEIQQVAEGPVFVEAGWRWSSWLVEVAEPAVVGEDRWTVEFNWTDPGEGRTGTAVVEVWQTGTIMSQGASGEPELDEAPTYDARIVGRAGFSLAQVP